jgi:hypothetical protein
MYTCVGKIFVFIVIAAALSASNIALANVCDHIQSYIGGDLSYNKYRCTNDFENTTNVGGDIRTKVLRLDIIGGIRYDENFC